MDTNYIWILAGKKLSGEATREELAELEVLIASFPEGDFPLREIEDLWRSGQNTSSFSSRQLEDKWKTLEKKLIYAKTNRIGMADRSLEYRVVNYKRRYFRFAAVLLLLVFSFFSVWLLKNNNKPDLRTNVIIAPAGAISQIKLPDGSKVWLNAGSKLTYQNQFGKKYRDIRLSGEAFFDVVKDPEHPFIVTTNTFRLKVLGTAFNVRSFNKDRTSEAALVRGSIEVTLVHSPDKKIILKPSEKLIVRNIQHTESTQQDPGIQLSSRDDLPLITLSNMHYHNKTDSLPTEAQWMEKKLVFDSENFEDISQKMERFYNVKIVFKNANIKKLKFTGSFQNESIHNAMKALQNSAYFHFEIKGNQITIE